MNLSIALVQVINSTGRSAMNKDLNGGFGTKDHYGSSLTSKLLMWIKKKGVRLPIISLAHLQAILKEKGNKVRYYEGFWPGKDEIPDLVLIYGSIVDYINENAQAKELQKIFPKAKIGFVGPFPSQQPELFLSVDFVIRGEPEAFFINEFQGLHQLKGVVNVSSLLDMDALPCPDFDGFPTSDYNYRPLINKTPFVTLLSSKGCPYSCRFYCVYGEVQGAKIRQRPAKKVVDDIEMLQKKYNIKGIQFRDPVFGLKKNFISEFVNELASRKTQITWGIETRLDLLNEENLTMMFDTGLRNINVGIETSNASIAKNNKRLLVEEGHQNRIVKFCSDKGINVSPFYILALEGDTQETMENTLRYAIQLNTLTARFSVSTPYPGTGYYSQLKKDDRLLTSNFEKFDQFSLVYKQYNLNPKQVDLFLEKAYRKYYFRLSYLARLSKGLLKGKFFKA